MRRRRRRLLASLSPGVCAIAIVSVGVRFFWRAARVASNAHAVGVKFATCMRDHGVANFPDPEADSGVQIPVSLAKNPSPAFASAMHACKYLVAANMRSPTFGQAAGACRVAF
jgi:hypothetical protein